jgi:hypothetical protein
MPRISKGLTQAYALQDFTFEVAMSLKESLSKENGKLKITREDAQSIAAVVKSWEACQQRIQVHRRVPNPGSLKHAVQRVKRKPQITSAEPLCNRSRKRIRAAFATTQ